MIKFRDDSKAKVNGEYKPPDKIQADRKQVYWRYNQMKNARFIAGQNLEDIWERSEKQYEAWRPPKDPADWQSNIVPPITTTLVERGLAEIIDQTVQPSVIARGPEDIVRAKAMNHIKDYTWEISDGDLNLYSALKQELVLGTTVWQEDYWQDKRLVKVLKKFDLEKGEEEYVEREIFDYDDVYGENIDIRNFFIDPMAKTINMGRYKANDCIRRFVMNYDTFMEQFKDSIYDQFGAVRFVKPGGDLNYWQYYQPPSGIDSNTQVEVLFYWGRRPDKLIIIANDIVIRDGPNPFNHKQLPFAEGTDIPRLNSFWGKGEPTLLESIQDELTTMRRMRTDRLHMDLWKMFLVSNRETLDDDEAVIAPSRFLYVDDPSNSIKALDYRDINPSAYREEELLKQDARQVTGIESPQPAETATQAAIFKESTMKALRLKIWLNSRNLVTNIIRLRVPNISQFYSVPKVAEILGESNMAKLSPQFRTITTNDVELKMSKTGELREEEKKGQFFFTVTPDLVTPFYGKFNYKLSAEATFPVSKPLQQQKANEFSSLPVVQQAIESGYWSPGKVADELAKINDFDPEKFKQPVVSEEQEQMQMTEDQLYELANRENEAMLNGAEIPGTAFATRGHTNIHLAFMGSEQFKIKAAEDPTLVPRMSKHIMFEGEAQTLRTQGGQPGPGAQPLMDQYGGQTTAQGVESGEAQAAMPGRMLTGGQNTMSGMSQAIK